VEKTAVIIGGSKSDSEFIAKITSALENLSVEYKTYYASAHKEPLEVLNILKSFESKKHIVYITVAGRSNALSAFVAANSCFPTIACPPFSDKLDMLVNIHSSLQMPSNVPVMTILEPANAALATKRIFDLIDNGVKK
jgi:5-(carboxyamino)imidazole ribonucleotide mutase